MSQTTPFNPVDSSAQTQLDQAVKWHQAGRLKEAWQLYQAILSKQPNHPIALNLTATLATQFGKTTLAETCFRRAIAALPDYSEAHYNLANLLRTQDRLQEAEASYRKAIKIHPNAAAWDNLGNTLEILGRKDEAKQAYRKAIQLQPTHTQTYWHLCRGGHGLNSGDRPAMQALLENKQLSAEQQACLHFALALDDDRKDNIDEAFDHFKQANAYHRSSYDYDYQRVCEYFLTYRQILKQQLDNIPPDTGHTSDKPIFILGMPRSGSTLVEQIIASHPDACGIGESDFLDKTATHASQLKNTPIPACFMQCTPDDFSALGEFYLSQAEAKAPSNILRITDKMPSNFRLIGLIALCFPNATIIHTTRHPMDTCFSIFRTYFNHANRYAYDLKELGYYYLFYQEMMQFWQALLPGRIYEVNYETLIEHFEPEARKLIEHCGLKWDDRCLEFYNTKRSVHTASNIQVRTPLYTSSIGTWKRYAKHLEPLKEVLSQKMDID